MNKECEAAFPLSLADEVFSLLKERNINCIRYCDLKYKESRLGSRYRYADEFIRASEGSLNPWSAIIGLLRLIVIRKGEGKKRLEPFLRKLSQERRRWEGSRRSAVCETDRSRSRNQYPLTPCFLASSWPCIIEACSSCSNRLYSAYASSPAPSTTLCGLGEPQPASRTQQQVTENANNKFFMSGLWVEKGTGRISNRSQANSSQGSGVRKNGHRPSG